MILRYRSPYAVIILFLVNGLRKKKNGGKLEETERGLIGKYTQQWRGY